MNPLPERPLLKYPGSKWRIANQIIALFPEHRIFVDVFGGGGNIIFRKQPSMIEVYNDLDRGMVNLFRVLQSVEQSEKLKHMLKHTLYSREEYERAHLDHCHDAVLWAWSILVRAQMGYATRGGHSRTGFSSNVTENHDRAGNWRRKVDVFDSFVERFRGVVVENRDYRDMLSVYKDSVDALLYVDPPYPASTRNRAMYRHEMMSDDQHRELATVLKPSKAKVVLSGYACDLYDMELFADWHRVTIAARAEGKNSARTEVLWMNFNPKPLVQTMLFTV